MTNVAVETTLHLNVTSLYDEGQILYILWLIKEAAFRPKDSHTSIPTKEKEVALITSALFSDISGGWDTDGLETV